MKRLAVWFILPIVLFSIFFATSISLAAPTEKEVLKAIRKATDFMVNEVSNRGGYLWSYSADLSRGWGEAMARPSQIELHQMGTPGMGELFLEVYNVTNDEYYLRCAEKAANAIIWGQHPLGGWHYFIDFDMTGIEQWYEDVASKFIYGMEEYRHFYGNCSYDDGATQLPTLFLLNLYITTLDPAYREPLLNALNFFLISQYPNGAWPQRYPLSYEFVHDGLADYTSYYTFNDGVMRSNIDVFLKAYEQLGNEEYRKAAVKGMDFYIASQGPEEQAGWNEQHGMDMKPAWGRTHEPQGYCTWTTTANIRDLERFYTVTGDRRYLKPIPAAVRWLEKSSMGLDDDGRHKLANYYELDTNKPLFMHLTDEFNEEGYALYRWDNEPKDIRRWDSSRVDIEAIKSEYERVSALTPEEAMAEYKIKRNAKAGVPKVDPSKVEELIKSMDERGAWVEEIRVYASTNNDPDYPWANTPIQGITTSSFARNMRTFINYLKNIQY